MAGNPSGDRTQAKLCEHVLHTGKAMGVNPKIGPTGEVSPLQEDPDVRLVFAEAGKHVSRPARLQIRKGMDVTDLLQSLIRAEMADVPEEEESQKNGRNKQQETSPKRSWTQPDLDEAIREYKAKRAGRYAELKDAIEDGKSEASEAAQKLFGRNAIARFLSVKSQGMVGKSPAWIAMAEDLHLHLKRNGARGTRRTQKPGKIGEEIAQEKAAERVARDAVPAVERREQEETRRQIRQLAKSSEKGKEDAEALLEKYEMGEITDEQVRQTVKTLLEPLL